jgi:hypothetical protein
VAITTEQIWDLTSSAPRPASSDTFVLGEPARPARTGPSEPARLVHDVDWTRVARSLTRGFFDGRDPTCSVGTTLAKMLGVVVGLTGVSLITLGALAALGVWSIRALFG